MTNRGGPWRQPARLQDVAAAAGVHFSIVSRVLRSDPKVQVRPETRQRIFETAERLGYRPNLAARSLRTARAMALGLVVPDLSNTGYSELACGADERANALGYVLLYSSGLAPDRLAMLHGRVDGLLCAIPPSSATNHLQLPKGTPSLLVHHRAPGVGPSIAVDDEAGAALATRHLIALGHRRIGHIVSDVPLDTSRRRAAGHRRAMHAAGLPTPADLEAPATLDERGGHRAMIELLDRDPRPTAVFAPNARSAIGALAACCTLGVDVPGELSLVAFSDVPIARYTRPPLTVVQLPFAVLGARAVDMLLELIDGKPFDDVMLTDPPELIVRGTTAPISA